MSRYVILGAGAVGVTLAAQLQEAARSVVLVGRGRQLDLLRSGRMRYLRPDGARVLDVPAVAGPAELTLEADDVLVLATKTQDAEAALAPWAWQPVTGTDAVAADVVTVLTVQNGMAAARTALRRFAHVLGGVLLLPASYVTAGEVVSPGAPAVGVVALGEYPDAIASPVARRIAADLTAAQFRVEVVHDLSRWLAAKLVVSAGFVLDALYTPGPERDRAAHRLQAETRDVLEQAGFAVADLASLDRSALTIRPVPGHEYRGTSTWQSLARAGDVETDFLNGEVVLLAREAGHRAPLNAALNARIHRAARDGITPGSLGPDDLAETLAPATTVSAARLRAEIARPQPPALLDVRWALGDSDGEKHYLDAHLPGAVYVDLETELAAPPTALGGRHPLPDPADLERAARRWGIRAGQPVVVYDAAGGLSAARAWWLLRWAGVADVRLLDGGLQAWTAVGGELEAGSHQPDVGDVRLRAGHLPTLDADRVAGLAGSPLDGVVLDARAGERYRGETEPVDPRAGHVPGAVSAPTADNLAADGRFKSASELRRRFAAAGVQPVGAAVGVYCGSGITAAHEIAALELAGVEAALFPGSWSAWSADPARPVAVGTPDDGKDSP